LKEWFFTQLNFLWCYSWQKGARPESRVESPVLSERR